jgi:hypothetical protein
MGTYYKINNQGKIENTIVAEKDFINTQPDKEKYFKVATNDNEKGETYHDFSYALNEPLPKYEFKKETNELILIEEPVFDFEKRRFKNPQPFPSWILNEETYEWEPPISKPTMEVLWNEEEQKWIKHIK